jgi:hypothetical protein
MTGKRVLLIPESAGSEAPATPAAAVLATAELEVVSRPPNLAERQIFKV